MKAIFVGEALPGAAELAQHLFAGGLTLVTANSTGGHGELLEAGIPHKDISGLSSVSSLLAGIDGSSEPGIALVVGGLGDADIGAHTMVRTAAALHDHTVVIVDSSDFAAVQGKASDGKIAVSATKRRALAAKALRATSDADQRMAEELFKPTGGEEVLVIGSGGREHAIALKLAESPSVSHVYVAPGNGGTGGYSGDRVSNVVISVGDLDGIVQFAVTKAVSLVVVGPEVPLVTGIADKLACAGVPCFGPSKAAARLEASKTFSKDFMARNGIRTARYATFSEYEPALAHVLAVGYRVVVKASGLAAGKGVLIPETTEEAVAALETVMLKKEFGDAGKEVVVEEFLEGEEVSILAVCDGKVARCMPGAQDHKRALDGDQGLNTGGMGAYAPAPCLTPELAKECHAICQATVEAMAREGTPFVGVLFAGFMLTAMGPVVLEFNVRMGDPETQVVLPLMKSDLYQVASACVQGRLAETDLSFTSDTDPGATAATVVLAAGGYPGKYPKGMPISGLEEAGTITGVTVYHAGTRVRPDDLGPVVECSGGRVLAVTGTGVGLSQALERAYRGVERVQFEPRHYRKDIGHRALTRAGAGVRDVLRIGVLASGRGTALQPVLDAVRSGALRAVVAVVVTNKSRAFVRERARENGVAEVFVSAKGRMREDFDAEVSRALEAEGVDLVLCVGYMRILSAGFCRRWEGRCLNVHPSLLPDFAGGMDLQVHEAVIAAGRKRSGCTVHQVTEEVDSGPIVVQEEVEVAKGETPESLKAKVQAKEGLAFLKAIDLFLQGQGVGTGKSALATEAAPAPGLSYKDSGVDIDAGNALVERIKPACKSTLRSGCDADLGGFGGLFNLRAAGYDEGDTVLVGATDGVGTKLKVAQLVGDHTGVGVDLVAMCVNDLIVMGAEPLFFLDYYATGKLTVDEAAAVIEGIAKGCRQANCGLIGGETAEMPSMYPAGDYDLAGFSVGAVRRGSVLPKPLTPGDVLLGLRSSGVHSNGFSLVRKIVEREGLRYSDPAPFASPPSGESLETLGKVLLTPTRIYVRQVLPLLRAGVIKALAHITGGGLPENLPRVLGPDLVAILHARGGRGEGGRGGGGRGQGWQREVQLQVFGSSRQCFDGSGPRVASNRESCYGP